MSGVTLGLACTTVAGSEQRAQAASGGALSSSRWDVFLSHYQVTGGDQCLLLREALVAAGLRVWYDQDYEPTAEGMAEGVRSSAVLLSFLSADVYKRWAVQHELHSALAAGTPIVFVAESDPARGGDCSVASLLADAREDIAANGLLSEDGVRALRSHPAAHADAVIPFLRGTAFEGVTLPRLRAAIAASAGHAAQVATSAAAALPAAVLPSPSSSSLPSASASLSSPAAPSSSAAAGIPSSAAAAGTTASGTTDLDHVPMHRLTRPVPPSERHAHILIVTGWTGIDKGEYLRSALRRKCPLLSVRLMAPQAGPPERVQSSAGGGAAARAAAGAASAGSCDVSHPAAAAASAGAASADGAAPAEGAAAPAADAATPAADAHPKAADARHQAADGAAPPAAVDQDAVVDAATAVRLTTRVVVFLLTLDMWHDASVTAAAAAALQRAQQEASAGRFRIVALHELDSKRGGHPDFYEFVKCCPPQLKELYQAVLSEPFERRRAKRAAMLRGVLAAAGARPVDGSDDSSAPLAPPRLPAYFSREPIESELALLAAGLASHRIVISGGTGGFGKTTLATAAVRSPDVVDRFQSVLWLTLGRGAGAYTLRAMLLRLLGELEASDSCDESVVGITSGVARLPQELPPLHSRDPFLAPISELALRIRRALVVAEGLGAEGRRGFIIVADDVEGEEAMRALAIMLPPTGASRLLITTRSAEVALAAVSRVLPGAAKVLSLSTLALPTAAALLERTAGIRDVRVPQVLLGRLAQAVGCVPLGLQIVACALRADVEAPGIDAALVDDRTRAVDAAERLHRALLSAELPRHLDLVGASGASYFGGASGFGASGAGAPGRARGGGGAGMSPTDAAVHRAIAAVKAHCFSRSDADKLALLGVFDEDAEIPANLVAIAWRMAASPADLARCYAMLSSLETFSLLKRPTPETVQLHDLVWEHFRAVLADACGRRIDAANASGAAHDVGGAGSVPVDPSSGFARGSSGAGTAAAAAADAVPSLGPSRRQVRPLALAAAHEVLLQRAAAHLQGSSPASAHATMTAPDVHLEGAQAALWCRLMPHAPASTVAAHAAEADSAGTALAARLIHHLCCAGRTGEATGLVFTLSWLQASVESRGIDAVLAEGDELGHHLVASGNAANEQLQVLLDALRQASNALRRCAKTERCSVLCSQLLCRITARGHASGARDSLAALLAAAASWNSSHGGVWLRPALASLESDGGQCTAAMRGHSSFVDGVLSVANERFLVSWAQENFLCVWETSSGERVHVLEGHSNRITGAIALPDGRSVASWSADQTLAVWDVVSGARTASLPGHKATITGATVLMEGRILASWAREPCLRLWYLAEDSSMHALDGHTDWVHGAAAIDDRRLLSWSADRTLRLWDILARTQIGVLSGHTASVEGVLLKDGGRQAVSFSSDGSLRIWNISDGSCVHDLRGHGSPVKGAVLLPSEAAIVSWSWPGAAQLRVWNTLSGALEGTLPLAAGRIKGVHACRHGAENAVVVWGDRDSLWVVDAASNSLLQELRGHTTAIRGTAMQPDGRILWSWADDNSLRAWDTSSWCCLHVFEGYPDFAWGALALTRGRLATWARDGSIRMWQVALAVQPTVGEAGAAAGEPAPAPRPARRARSSLVLSDGNIILTWSAAATIAIWDARSAALCGELAGHTGSVESVLQVQCAHRSVVVSRSVDRTLRLWDVGLRSCLHVLRGHTEAIQDAVVLDDARTVVSIDAARQLRVWNTLNGACSIRCRAADLMPSGQSRLLALPGAVARGVVTWGGASTHIIDITSLSERMLEEVSWKPVGVQHAPTSSLLVIWSAGMGLRIANWAVAQWASLEGHTSTAHGALVLPDGKSILSWSDDCTLRVWSALSARCLQTLSGHTTAVAGAVVLGDGASAVSWAGTQLRVWSLASGQCERVLTGHADVICGAVALSDGCIVSWSGDGALLMWTHNQSHAATSMLFDAAVVEVTVLPSAARCTSQRLVVVTKDERLHFIDIAWAASHGAGVAASEVAEVAAPAAAEGVHRVQPAVASAAASVAASVATSVASYAAAAAAGWSADGDAQAVGGAGSPSAASAFVAEPAAAAATFPASVSAAVWQAIEVEAYPLIDCVVEGAAPRVRNGSHGRGGSARPTRRGAGAGEAAPAFTRGFTDADSADEDH